MENNLQLLLKYPLITCEDITDKTRHYSGIIPCGTTDYNVRVTERKKGAVVRFNLKTFIGKEVNDKIANVKPTNNIVDFLDQVKSLLETKLTEPKNLTIAYKRILHEYSEFTRFHLNIRRCHLATDLSCINVTAADEAGREHHLTISVSFEEIRDLFVPISFHLPEHFHKDLAQKWSSLTELYDKFLATIEALQDFFDVMDALDRNCYVLDPEAPTRSDCYRRIWLDQNLSVVITINATQVTNRPELKFLGPERVVQQRYQQLNDELGDWDGRDFFQGLLNILGLEEFPSKPETSREMLMEVGECSICFSLRLNDKLPEVVCGNKSCENVFHAECLYEWLTSVTSKRMFNRIHGQCPNCEKGISCPLPGVT